MAMIDQASYYWPKNELPEFQGSFHENYHLLGKHGFCYLQQSNIFLITDVFHFLPVNSGFFPSAFNNYKHDHKSYDNI